MEWHWRRHKKLKEIDPVKYYESVESGMTMPVGVVLGVDPATLTFGMFRPCLRKLGSDE
jgi:3-polyprenyl-4-hydroxybenzoate decarboxylase